MLVARSFATGGPFASESLGWPPPQREWHPHADPAALELQKLATYVILVSSVARCAHQCGIEPLEHAWPALEKCFQPGRRNLSPKTASLSAAIEALTVEASNLTLDGCFFANWLASLQLVTAERAASRWFEGRKRTLKLTDATLTSREPVLSLRACLQDQTTV